MKYLWVVILALLTFGACFGLDKLFSKVFRASRQHRGGLKVTLRKRVAVFGLLMLLLGLVCLLFYWGSPTVVFWSGWILLFMGICMLVYYLSFGVYYDEEGFVYSRFGKKSKLYTYDQILTQQLYNSQGSVLVELQLSDGSTVPVQDSMEGGFAFLDYAFARWLAAKGLTGEDCPFHKPEKCCWFAPQQEVT